MAGISGEGLLSLSSLSLDLEGLLQLVRAALVKMVKTVWRTDYTLNCHGLPRYWKGCLDIYDVKCRYVDSKRFGGCLL